LLRGRYAAARPEATDVFVLLLPALKSRQGPAPVRNDPGMTAATKKPG
jgi:hypothetical protein